MNTNSVHSHQGLLNTPLNANTISILTSSSFSPVSHVIQSKETDLKRHVQEKTIQRPWYKRIGSSIAWGSTKVATKITTSLFTTTINKTKQALELPKEFQDSIKQFAPKLAEYLCSIPKAAVYLKPLLDHKKDLFVKTLEDTLIFGAGNLIRNVPQREANGVKTPPSLADIGAHLMFTTKFQLDADNGKILKDIGEATGNGDFDTRDNLIRQVIEPILWLAFPNGPDDLPVRNLPMIVNIRAAIWDAINCPEILTKVYELLTQDTGLTQWLRSSEEFSARKKEISATPDGQVAIALSKYTAQLIMTEVMPSQLDDTVAKALAKSTTDSIHEQIGKLASELGEGTELLKNEANVWMSQLTNSIMRNNSTTLTIEAMKKLQDLFPTWAKSVTDDEWNKLQKLLIKEIKNWLNAPSGVSAIAKADAITQAISKLIPYFYATSPGSLKDFNDWLSKRLESAPNESPHAEKVWEHAQEHVEEIILNIFYPPNRPPKPLSFIFTGCLEIANSHRQIIQKKIDELAGIASNDIQKQKRIKNEIEICFQNFARDLLLFLEVEKDKKFTVLFDPIKTQFAQIIMDKLYPSLMKPLEAYPEIFDKLCWALYDKSFRLHAKKGLDDFDQELSDPKNLTHDQQKKLWKSSGSEEAAKSFELFFKGVAAPEINTAGQNFLQDVFAAELLNSCLELGLDQSGVAALQKELSELAKANSPAKKVAWEYHEKVIQALLPKLVIPIMKEIDDSQPASTSQPATTHKLKKLPEQFLTRLLTWADDRLKEDTNAQTGIKRVSFEDLCSRSKDLTQKLQKRQTLELRLKLLKTKLQHRLPVLHAKLKAKQAAANSLPQNQRAEKVKLINDFQEELLATEKKLEEELKILQEEMDEAISDINQNGQKYQTELDSVQSQMKERFYELSKDLLKKFGSDVTKPDHVLFDYPFFLQLKQHLWDKVIPDILCNLMFNHHPAICPETSSISDELSVIYEGQCVQDMSEALDKFTESYLPHMLAHDEEVTKQLFEIFKNMLPSGKIAADDFRKFIKDNQKDIISVLTNNTNMLGKSQNPVIKKLWSYIGGTSESFSLQILGGLSKAVLEMLARDPLALAKYTTKEMVRFADYVQEVNDITKKAGAKYPYEVNPALMLNQLQQKQDELEKQYLDLLKTKQQELAQATASNKNTKQSEFDQLKRIGPKQILHPALRKHYVVEKDGTSRELSREEAQMEKLFKPLAKKLMKISGLKITDKNAKIYQFLEETLYPLFIQILYTKTAGSRNTMKQMQLTLVNNLQAVCADIESQLLGEYQPQNPIQNTQIDTTTPSNNEGLKKVMTRMGKLVLELAKWLGKSITTDVSRQSSTIQIVHNLPKSATSQEKELIHASGKVLRELIDWLPGTAANALIKNFETIKKMTEEQLGTATNDFIAQRDVINDFFKPMIQTSTSCIHPGTWSNNRFKTTNVKVVNGHEKNLWSFDFNFTPAQIARHQAEERYTESLASKRTRELANQGVDVTIMQTWNNMRQKAWEKIAYGIERATEAVFASHAKPIQLILKAITALIGCIGILALYAGAVLILPIYAAISRAHTYLQVRHLDKNLSMDINHNVLMYALEDFIDSVEKSMGDNNLQKAANSPQPVAAPFNSWDQTQSQIKNLQSELTQLSQFVRSQSALQNSQKAVI